MNKDVMTIRTEYPYQTLRIVPAGGDAPVMDLWIVYVPLDKAQKTIRTFGLLSIRKPKNLLARIGLNIGWPFLVAFTERIFREDRHIVEAEQAAHDAQGAQLEPGSLPGDPRTHRPGRTQRPAAGVREGFFFGKKKQKTFLNLGRACVGATGPIAKKFLRRFFQKAALFFVCSFSLTSSISAPRTGGISSAISPGPIFCAAWPCSHTPAQAASKSAMPWASRAAMMPASTSPVPAGGKPGRRVIVDHGASVRCGDDRIRPLQHGDGAGGPGGGARRRQPVRPWRPEDTRRTRLHAG